MPLAILTTGFVGVNSGSVASANAVLLEKLIERGNRVTFFSKPTFVDPRPRMTDPSSIEFVDCTNAISDGLRRRLASRGPGIWKYLWGRIDSANYNRLIIHEMGRKKVGDVDLWLGDWSRSRRARPTVSFVQGPPGTDARSIQVHRVLIERLAGKFHWLKLAAYAKWRLSVGLPQYRLSDHVIVGSEWSRQTLVSEYGLAPEKTHSMPYPIDLTSFQPSLERLPRDGKLRLFWLGRFAPRKRLDLFLDGLAIAIRSGTDVEAWIVGKSAFVPNFERLIEEFPYPNRIKHWASVPRKDIPAMLAKVDVLAQPSDCEDFGSSVAEALACGVAVIVGASNGTGDYICGRSIRLIDDRPETMAAAVTSMADAKKRGDLIDPEPSRSVAKTHFDPETVTDRLESVLRLAVSGK